MVSSALCFRYLLLAVGTCIGVTRVLAGGLNPFSAPYAGQVIPVGQPFEIQWSPGTPGPVFIALEGNTIDGTGNITNSTPNNGSYIWTPNPIDAVDNGGQGYFLQICDLITRDCTYTYGRFFLVNSTSATSSTSVGSVLPSPSVSFTTGVLQTDSSSTSATSTTSSTTSASPTAASTSPPAPTPNHSGGLSTGAQVAIGVVVSVLGTAALLVGGYFILRRRRRTEAAKKEQGPPREYTKPELSGDGIRKDDRRGGINGHGSGNAYELSSSEQAQVHELATEYERPR